MRTYLNYTVTFSFFFFVFSSFAAMEPVLERLNPDNIDQAQIETLQETWSQQVKYHQERTSRKLKESFGLLAFGITNSLLGSYGLYYDLAIRNNYGKPNTLGDASILLISLGLTSFIPTTINFIETWYSYCNKVIAQENKTALDSVSLQKQ